MKVAIPIFGRWVSPRFSFASEMLIVTIEKNKVVSRSKVITQLFVPSQLINQLSLFEVEVLICGGVEGFCHRQIESMGISIISDVAGDVNEVLELFIKGKLVPGYRIRGGKGSGCRRGRRFFVPPWISTKDE